MQTCPVCKKLGGEPRLKPSPAVIYALPFQKPALGVSMSNLYMSPPSRKGKMEPLEKCVCFFSADLLQPQSFIRIPDLCFSRKKKKKTNLGQIRRSLGHVPRVTLGESGVGDRWQSQQGDSEDMCIRVTSCKGRQRHRHPAGTVP